MTPAELRQLRNGHQLTQRAMAQLLGYTENYIRRLENGHVPITQRFEKLTVALLPKKSGGKSKKYSDTP